MSIPKLVSNDGVFGWQAFPSAPPQEPLGSPTEAVPVRLMQNETPLHEAVLNGNLSLVQRWIAEGVNVHEKDSTGKTAIAYAKNRAIIQELLNAGAQIHPTAQFAIVTEESNKAFLQAIKGGNLLAIKDLIERGLGDVHAQFNDLKTSLHIAAEQGDPLVVLLLIRAGADMESKDTCQNTPLMITGFTGKTEAAEVLLKEGASVNSCNKSNETTLHIAANKGFADTVACLIQYGANINAVTIKGYTPLIFSLSLNTPFPYITTLLLDAGADPFKKDGFGQTVFHHAVKHGLENLIERLMHMGLPIDEPDNAGKTPFLYAASGGQIRMMQKFKPQNAADYFNRKSEISALHYAAASGDPECIVFAMKELNIDVNYSVKGITPLHWAAQVGKANGIECLLQFGANIEAKKETGATPLCAAVEAGNLATVRCLLQHKADPNVLFSVPDLISSLLTPLHVVAVLKLFNKQADLPTVEIAKALLEHGANLEGRGQVHLNLSENGVKVAANVIKRLTPLHCAATAEDKAMVEFLLVRNANVLATDSGGKYPHQRAKAGPLHDALLTAYNKKSCTIL